MASCAPGGGGGDAGSGSGPPLPPSHSAGLGVGRKRGRDAAQGGVAAAVPTVVGNDNDVGFISDADADALVGHIVISDGDSDTLVADAASRSATTDAADATAATVAVLSGAGVQEAGAATRAPTRAGSRATDDGGGAGAHLQTAADLLGASALAASAGRTPSPVGGMALARVPLELTYSLPPSTAGPSAAEVYLVVDDRETAGVEPSRAAFLARLRVNPGLADRVVQRRLPIGDALLVARVTTAGAAAVAGAPPAGTEIMLDQLVERKTASDVVASLRDGRLDEQTYYMAASGRSSLICIVEGDLEAATQNDANMCAAAETFLATLTVSTPFFIKYTGNLEETAAYFASLVRHLGRRLGSADGLEGWLSSNRPTDGGVPGADGVLTYSLWETEMAEMRGSATLQQMWALQLLVIPGIGPARANTIVQGDFKVPAALAAAYRATSTPEEGKALLASLTPPPGCARIPTHVSTYMYQLFVSHDYGAVALRQ